ncbi:MAG: GntR family transcriptional regulator [Clostridiales bacterium]|nr:GntR family transcriptional regulator [Clostridiales bacterium]
MIKLDITGDVPIYQQIRNQIVYGVATGQLSIGERLPTVRQLAGDIGVNPMTVSKAYGLLKDEGIIVIDRRQGAKINRLPVDDKALNEEFDQKVKLLISEARMKGISQDEIRKHINQLIDNVYEKKEGLH